MVLALGACSSSASADDYCAAIGAQRVAEIRDAERALTNPTGSAEQMVAGIEQAFADLHDAGQAAGEATPDELADAFDAVAASQGPDGAGEGDLTDAASRIIVYTDENC